MTSFEQTRGQLVRRRADLLRRIDGIEDDLRLHGHEPSRSGRAVSAGSRAIGEFIDSLNHELGLIESALHRIDAREYDCCMSCGGTIRADRLELLPYAVNCASCSRDFPRDYISQLRVQHSNLRRSMISVLELLLDVIRQCDIGASTPESQAPTLTLLSDLGRQFPEHFELEEKNGYMEEALAVAPRYAKRAKALMEEHPRLSQEIFTIVKAAQTAGDSSIAWRGVHERFKQLTLDVLAHEEAENDIMESAFLDDLGSGH